MGIKPILLDTNAYTAFKKGVPQALEIVRRALLIGLNSIILGELLGGFYVGGRKKQNVADLETFLASPRVQVFPLDADTAQKYAEIYAHLRQKGTPIPTNDMWIAATVMQYKL